MEDFHQIAAGMYSGRVGNTKVQVAESVNALGCEEVTWFIDIKLASLHDILRVVLHDIKAISLMEDKQSQNHLFHFLPELERCAENMNNSSDYESTHAQHLRLLIDPLKHTYTSISQRRDSMLQHSHITYDLLWALFKPGSHVFTTCIGTKEPRCSWWNLGCRFIDNNGVNFGDAGIFLGVTKFRGSRPIEIIEAFPLRYHPRHEEFRKDLIERGQKFWDLASSHIWHCKGSAFSMNKGDAIKVKVNSRVAADAAFFLEIQPNYPRLSLRDLGVKEKDVIAVIDIGAMLMEDGEREKEKIARRRRGRTKTEQDRFLGRRPNMRSYVSTLRDVDWSPESFDSLQIPSETKTMPLSLANSRLGLIPTVSFDNSVCMILSWSGTQLHHAISDGNSSFFHQERDKALGMLRSRGIIHSDSGWRNMLWDNLSDRLVVLDLEDVKWLKHPSGP
ncbi:hypothetical protein N7481_002768 [Penicillium waksmanii]|uniref:uncharacterized protein n=1 Tax=Penicillium waksmanii TaxID=69791 RepID=UPI002546C5E1|nr:uncharacterized protein N7481_002768 [Penicillium waksmanii]KAJ5995791.1 hypothetical protein N7481_002768 [Penicillium waksmanii]